MKLSCFKMIYWKIKLQRCHLPPLLLSVVGEQSCFYLDTSKKVQLERPNPGFIEYDCMQHFFFICMSFFDNINSKRFCGSQASVKLLIEEAIKSYMSLRPQRSEKMNQFDPLGRLHDLISVHLREVNGILFTIQYLIRYCNI